MNCKLARGTFPLLLFTILTLSGVVSAQKATVRIGFILDGPAPANASLLSTFQEEIRVVLEDQQDVFFPGEKTLTGDWTASRVAELGDRLLGDPDVDVVISLGLIASQNLGLRDQFPKPVFCAFLPGADLGPIPSALREVETQRAGETERYRVSGKKNLNYLVYETDLSADLAAFQEIVPFSRLSILVQSAWIEVLPTLKADLGRELGSLGLDRLDVVPVGESASEALARIPADADAVYVTPLTRLSPGEWNQLVGGLNGRSLPTLSARGRLEVEQGLLAALRASDDPVRRARRIALNLLDLLDGSEPGEMSTEFSRKREIVINMATARAIGVSPPFQILLDAELVQAGIPGGRALSLGSVVREASTANLDLIAADRSVSAFTESVREARAPLLPQVGLSGGVSVIDADRARTFPTVGETQYSASLEASQLIYSDRAWAGYSIQNSLLDQRQEERAQLRLDVILESAQSYLDLLRAQTIERIQKDNLELTRRNLNLASSRVEIGVAGRDEVFRWESQISTNQRDVVNAGAIRNQARIAVNRVLNRPLNESFSTIEATLTDADFVASFDALGPYVNNPDGLAAFADFMAEDALDAAPELRQIDALMRAKQRELDSAKRSFFLPELSLSGGLTAFKFHGAGSELPAGLNNTDWFVGVGATLPLFQGGGRFAEVNRTRFELESLKTQHEAAGQRVEQRVRSVLETANASFIGIGLARRQAEAARQNLDLVSDSYAAGVVGILSLLDAQNQALVADLGAASAVYQYLSDLMTVQRAAGRFDFFRSPQDRQDFLNRLSQFYTERGARVRQP